MHPQDGEIGAGHDSAVLVDAMMRNVYGSRSTAEAFLPLLRRGMKRIAAITEIESSNSWSTAKTDLAYHASLAGLNMMGKILFNHLRPEGLRSAGTATTRAGRHVCGGLYHIRPVLRRKGAVYPFR